MKYVFLLLAALFILGLAVFMGSPFSFDTHDESGQAVRSETEESALPEPLNIPFLTEVPEPNNPCSNISVPEEIQQKRSDLADNIAVLEKRTEKVKDTISLSFELEKGSPDIRAVAFTIDTGTGGSYGITELLDIAAYYKIPLTFFLTGCWVVENPELTQRIVRDGHSIANHTLTHLNLADVSDERARYEIEETDRIFRDVTGFTPFLFRKPQYAGGERITTLAGTLGKISIQGYPDFGETTGWRSGSSKEGVLGRITKHTAPGAIWVFHNLSSSDLSAFEDAARFHLQDGYKIVPVEELIIRLYGLDGER